MNLNVFVISAVFSFLLVVVAGIGPCLIEIEQVTNHIQKMLDKTGSYPMDVPFPQCLEDGGYAPKQCYNDRCRCVGWDGTILVEDFASVNNEDETCKCSREQHEIPKGLVGKTLMCNQYGSYEPIQCTGSVCYCADADGKQIGTETAPIYEIDTLKCDDE